MSLNKYEHVSSQNTAVSKGNRLSETCRWHFNLILPIMPYKVAFMSEDSAALCTVANGEPAILNRS